MAGWGTSDQPRRFMLRLSAGASMGATSIAVDPLEAPIGSGVTLVFGGISSGKIAVTSALAVQGATTVAVAALPAALSAGDTASWSGADVPAPKTWVDAAFVGDWPGRVRARHLNGVLEQATYLAGRQAPEGTYVTAAEDVAVDAETFAVEPLEDAVPADSTLYFVSAEGTGETKPVRVTTAAEAGGTTLLTAPVRVAIDSGDRAPWPAQDSAELDAVLLVPALGAVAEEPRTELEAQFVSGTGALFRFLAEHLTDNDPADHQDILFVFRKEDATEEILARIRAFRDGGPNGASIYITTATGGVLAATPALVLRYTRQVGVNGSPSGFTLDVNGDLNLDADGEFVGVALWPERPAGTLSHNGSAEVTGQLRSTVATGTAPIQPASGAGMVRNLNVPLLSGQDWAAAALQDDATDTLDTASTEYTLGTVTADETALWLAVGAAVVEVDTDDEGADFAAVVTGAQRNPAVGLPTIGMKSQVISFGLNSLASAATATLKASKSAGTGTSPAAGQLVAVRYGFA